MSNEPVYINGRFLTHKMTGIPRFSYEMCKAMYQLGMNIRVIAPQSEKNQQIYPFPVIYYGKKKSHLWEQIDLYFFMRKKKQTILISLSGLGPLLYSNHITTIHDLSFWKNPQWFSFLYRLIYKTLTPIVAKRARKILTVSRFSKKEIVDCLHIPAEKIEVINNAVSSDLKSDRKIINSSDRATTEKYILMVSSHDPRKNLSRAIEAFLSLDLKEIKLYLTGDEGDVFKDIQLNMNHPSIRFLGRISDDQLIDYYRNAALFLYPSLYEGFGIPPLEAMANGCPVLVSDIEPLREVLNDSAFYCDPYDIHSIANGILTLLENSEQRNRLIQKGYEREKLYNWHFSAQKIKQIIENDETIYSGNETE
jgi:glycosyltransferase involved in cell wall biosynthesis